MFTSITNDKEHEEAVNQLIQWNQAPDAHERLAEIQALGELVEAYEIAAGHTPDPPQTLRGILEVEMFKRRIRQKNLAEMLEVTETRLSEIMRGKREMNMDFARKLYTKLKIPADVILTIS
ncbi:hypothetical protein [Hymenobacter cavernae]|uniref:HTH cro/C1-type domain-containing protein n=1 Tax=Hymenobacter cavernae TaxID=2044852 RepID=A0ABQ1UTT9_9BACT|nr:hypothetical protein [Hymenobacter cavernae]GGF26401.1 hypothetical protein GCM10011383_42400 [Hymenobacter cavernae]